MSKQLKKLDQAQIEKLMRQAESTLTSVKKNAELPWPQCMMAVGNAEAGLEHIIQSLKGEWPL